MSDQMLNLVHLSNQANALRGLPARHWVLEAMRSSMRVRLGRRLLIRTSSRSMNGKHDFLSRARDYGKHPEEARPLLAFL